MAVLFNDTASTATRCGCGTGDTCVDIDTQRGTIYFRVATPEQEAEKEPPAPLLEPQHDGDVADSFEPITYLAECHLDHAELARPPPATTTPHSGVVATFPCISSR